MERISDYITKMISRQVANDPCWQGINVIFSGPSVPGEGEHKIMEYIRLAKAKEGFDPNTRHCLYGLDADLILLGLLAHEPHFSLLREEVKFGGGTRKSNLPPVFYLLHLGLLREYFDLEFRSAFEGEAKMDWYVASYSVERVLDDFIMMTVLVGNDFLPNIPFLHINQNAFGLLLDAYKRTLPGLGGYLNEAGQVQYARLARVLQELVSFEMDIFDRSKGHLMDQKLREETKKHLSPLHSRLYKDISTYLIQNSDQNCWIQSPDLKLSSNDRSFLWKLATDFNLSYVLTDDHRVELFKVPINDDDSSDSEEITEPVLYRMPSPTVFKKYQDRLKNDSSQYALNEEHLEFEDKLWKEWKLDYYRSKFLPYQQSYEASAEQVSQLARKVAMAWAGGLQWNLFYYYKGVASWSWFYPYHYAPYLSDLIEAMETITETPKFDMDTPFRPLEQLLAVLPPASGHLLPRAIANLMTDPSSPLIEHYPENFEIDLNGKKADWEGVVLLSFIDAKVLIDCVRSIKLDPEWQRRNSFGVTLIFNSTSSANPSTYNLPVLELQEVFLPEVCQGAKALPGFPSLLSLPLSARLDSVGIQIFGNPQASKEQSLVLEVLHLLEIYRKGVEVLADELCSKQIFVDWPFLLEAKVSHLSDELFSYHEKKVKRPLDDSTKAALQMQNMERNYLCQKAVDFREGIDILVWAFPFVGLRTTLNGAVEKEYSKVAIAYPLQTIVPFDKSLEDTRNAEKAPMGLEELFPLGAPSLYIGPGYYGSLCTVKGHVDKKHISVDLVTRYTEFEEPTFIYRLAHEKNEQSKVSYVSGRQIADILGLSHILVSLITSRMNLFFKKALVAGNFGNIGLGLKFDTKGLRAEGYSKKIDNLWFFSQKAIDLLRSYMRAFPDLFQQLKHCITSPGNIDAELLFPGIVTLDDFKTRMAPIVKWIGDNVQVQLVPNECECLSNELVQLIDCEWQNYLKTNRILSKHISLPRVPASFLLSPKNGELRIASEIATQNFQLGHRVVFVGDHIGGVPFGSYGTVIGFVNPNTDIDGTTVLAVEVLLDKNPLGNVYVPNDQVYAQNRRIVVKKSQLLNLNMIPAIQSVNAEINSMSKSEIAAISPVRKNLGLPHTIPATSYVPSISSSRNTSNTNNLAQDLRHLDLSAAQSLKVQAATIGNIAPGQPVIYSTKTGLSVMTKDSLRPASLNINAAPFNFADMKTPSMAEVSGHTETKKMDGVMTRIDILRKPKPLNHEQLETLQTSMTNLPTGRTTNSNEENVQSRPSLIYRPTYLSNSMGDVPIRSKTSRLNRQISPDLPMPSQLQMLFTGAQQNHSSENSSVSKSSSIGDVPIRSKNSRLNRQRSEDPPVATSQLQMLLSGAQPTQPSEPTVSNESKVTYFTEKYTSRNLLKPDLSWARADAKRH